MKQLLLILTAVGSLSISSCKKEVENDPKQEVEEKIQGKWQIQNISINDNFSGEDHIKSYPGSSSEYVDFKSDGKMHTYFRGNLNVSDYSVLDVKKIAIGGDDASIKQLSDSTFRFSSKDATGSIGFTEVTYDLKR